uniref:Uncharacterized protein n=1 Tax=Octactis speculum TaxID=3111310 RepID=A0A7S2GJ62_9STRA|mmetsp:Transcript_4836/g.5820  ORF Transcript_4836/g.5820 Transcript_4836/m.5820 type:complete len:349 (+) Transcript_4836:874-1920(+)
MKTTWMVPFRHKKELKLNGNKLTGEIPSELGLLGNAKKIELKDNMLCGNIPDEVLALDGGVGLKIITDNSIGTPCVVSDLSTEMLPTYAPTPFVPIQTYGTSELDFVVEVGSLTCSEVFAALKSSLSSISTSAQTELLECVLSASSTRRHLTVTTMEIAIAVQFLLTDDGDESATDTTIQMVQEFTDDLTETINDNRFINLLVQSLGTDEVNVDTDALMNSLSGMYDTIEVEEIIRSRPPSFRPTTDPVQKTPDAQSNDLITVGGAVGGSLVIMCMISACICSRGFRKNRRFSQKLMKLWQDKESPLTERNAKTLEGDRGKSIHDSTHATHSDTESDEWEYPGWKVTM